MHSSSNNPDTKWGGGGIRPSNTRRTLVIEPGGGDETSTSEHLDVGMGRERRMTRATRRYSAGEQSQSTTSLNPSPSSVTSLASPTGDGKDEYGTLSLMVTEILDPPSHSGYIIKIFYGFLEHPKKDKAHVYVTPKITKGSSGIYSVNFNFKLGHLKQSTNVMFTLYALGLGGKKESPIGETLTTFGHICHRPTHDFFLENRQNYSPITNSGKLAPTRIVVKVDLENSKIPASWPQPEISKLLPENYQKHVMIVTRGTRGDIQPFVALARGMAEKKNWMVTIVSELEYRKFIKDYSKVSAGCIRFRPVGGNTTRTIDGSQFNQFAMNNKSEFIQAAILARSEAEFFVSEPMLYYWASTMKPDLLIYGFTMAALAMVVSESLHIPLIGFILQPTCIPSKHYTSLVKIEHNDLTHKALFLMPYFEEGFTSHRTQNALKGLLENTPGIGEFGQLNKLREKRGLRTYESLSSNSFRRLTKRNMPLIVPISPLAFGGKPADWGDNSVLTNFIFLRSQGVEELSNDMKAFIKAAKDAKEPLLVMGFSSMPIKREEILLIAHMIATKTITKPRVIALVGKQITRKIKTDIAAKIEPLKQEKRLFEASGAPFGKLFKEMDCLIIHGGLGTTAEALRVGKPAIVTGTLLMDQRFWGAQLINLGISPAPLAHIDGFPSVCVSYVDQALSKDSIYGARAHAFAEEIQESLKAEIAKGYDEDGVGLNVDKIEEFAKTPEKYIFDGSKGKKHRK